VGHEELRPSIRPSSQLAVGTLACSRCDAPIAIGDRTLTPTDQLDCPYCSHHGPLREFLSLTPPTRPTRVVVRISGQAVRVVPQR
jgi:hypothetical protein